MLHCLLAYEVMCDNLDQTWLKINHAVPYTNHFMTRKEITPIVQIVLTQ